MAEAQELGEQAKIKREEEERKRQAELEEEERKAEEEREKARQAAFDEVNNVQNTVDLDETRNLMEQYEREFNDNYSAGASPSSDFGF
jgi:vacuolar-type H+-ATPase subunit E/Vma4